MAMLAAPAVVALMRRGRRRRDELRAAAESL
jgi:hypothetical protein